MDVFYEESSIAQNAKTGKTKYTVLTIISRVFLVLGIMFLIILLNMLPLWVLLLPLVIAFFATWFIIDRFKQRFNVSYDYAFVSGELRIARVINVNKRKLLVKINSEEIIQFGDVDNPSFERFRKDPMTKMVVCTSNETPSEGKFFMYILTTHEGKKLYVLECRETLLMHILQFAKREKLDRDYVMQERKNK